MDGIGSNSRWQSGALPVLAEANFQPDLAALEKLITKRTRALVVINPNNPTGAVYSHATLQAIVDLAEKHGLVIFADEIYDSIVYDEAEFIPMATLVKRTLCGSLVVFPRSIGLVDFGLAGCLLLVNAVMPRNT